MWVDKIKHDGKNKTFNSTLYFLWCVIVHRRHIECEKLKTDKMSTTNKRLVRRTRDQIQYLCQYMTTHPGFAAGDYRSPLGARQNQEEWVHLKTALDEIGPQRSVEQWKVCWRDQKRKARLEGGARSRAINATGNSTEVPELSPNAALVLSAIGSEMAVGIGPEESPIGFDVEEVIIPAAVSFTEPALEAQEPLQGLPRRPRAARSRLLAARGRRTRVRVRRTLPHEQFLNAQLELNGLIRELVAEVRESNRLRREQAHQ